MPYEIDTRLKPLLDALIARRKALSLTQLDIDRMTGWAAGACGKYECGQRRPSLVALTWWAQAMGCSWTIQTDNFPKASWKTSANAVQKLFDEHECTLKLKETAVRWEKEFYRTVEAVDDLKTESQSLTERLETLSNQGRQITRNTLAQNTAKTQKNT